MAGRSCLLPLCLLAALTASSCRVPKDVVATVGDEHLTVRAFQDYLEAATSEEWQAVEQRVASRLLDQYLDQEVVVAAVRSSGKLPLTGPGHSTADVQLQLGELCGPVPPLPAGLLEREVQQRLEQTQPARAHVRQMLLSSADEAAAARQRVLDGEDFVTVSNEVSLAANAEHGGELGMVTQGTLPEPMDEVIFAMTAGSISAPVESPAGFHIFEVLETRAAGLPAREQVERVARRELTEQHTRVFLQECVDRLAAEVGVRTFASHLWFNYVGKYREDSSDGVTQ